MERLLTIGEVSITRKDVINEYGCYPAEQGLCGDERYNALKHWHKNKTLPDGMIAVRYNPQREVKHNEVDWSRFS